LGAQVISLDVGDLLVKAYYDRKIEELVAVIRETKPDVIITHSPPTT
jgi:LmbE family N-acetylglucosaminyl deacetylase